MEKARCVGVLLVWWPSRERVGLSGGTGGAAEAETGLLQIGRHALAHHAEADESYAHLPLRRLRETCILWRLRCANCDQIFFNSPGPQAWISGQPMADSVRHCEFEKLAVAA